MVADSNFGKKLPKAARRALAVRQMSIEETIAVCLCGAAKTTSLGIPLVAAMWATADDLTRSFIQIPVLLYTIEQVCYSPLLRSSLVTANVLNRFSSHSYSFTASVAFCAIMPNISRILIRMQMQNITMHGNGYTKEASVASSASSNRGRCDEKGQNTKLYSSTSISKRIY